MDAMQPCSMREPLLYSLRLGTFGFGGPIALAGGRARVVVKVRKEPEPGASSCRRRRGIASQRDLDPDPSSKHMGETQEERIWQFLEENDAPVVGLREGEWLRIEGKSTRLGGALDARIFRRGQPPVEKRSGEELEVAR
jgi:hypothetical protein